MGERLGSGSRLFVTEHPVQSEMPKSPGELLFRLAIHGGEAVVNKLSSFFRSEAKEEAVEYYSTEGLTIATAELLDYPQKEPVSNPTKPVAPKPISPITQLERAMDSSTRGSRFPGNY